MTFERSDSTEAAIADTRQEPDEASLEHATTPDPARRMRLRLREWPGILGRAAKRMPADNMPMIAQALAYSTFLAIPSVLLVAVGVFTLLAGPGTITTVIDHVGTVMPVAAKSLLSDSLHRLDHQQRATILVAIVGFVLAVWSLTGAMTTYMTAVNLAYEREDSRGFVKKRLTALVLVACMGIAFLLVAVFLIFGPTIEKHLGHALGAESFFTYVWWSAEWPIMLAGLLAAFGILLYLGPDADHRQWRFATLGSVLAVFMWLAVSAGFAFYTSHFSSYNKAWGSLAAVIVMLVWLWLTSLALLYGAEVDAEAERTRAGR